MHDYDVFSRIWDADTTEVKMELSGHALEVKCLALSSDNKTLFSGDLEGVIM